MLEKDKHTRRNDKKGKWQNKSQKKCFLGGWEKAGFAKNVLLKMNCKTLFVFERGAKRTFLSTLKSGHRVKPKNHLFFCRKGCFWKGCLKGCLLKLCSAENNVYIVFQQSTAIVEKRV